MACFADNAHYVVRPIIENVRMARDTYRVRIEAPELIQSVVPGQFYMLRNPAGNDPLIGRAFALYDAANDETGWLDLVYIVKGKLTSSLVRLDAGCPIAVWGPLGNGFSPVATEHLIMVAGGIGQTPFLALGKEALGAQQFGNSALRRSGYANRVTLCYGARSREYLACVDDFRALGIEVHLATDDGTLGDPQLVTDLLQLLLAQSNPPSVRIVTCGPVPMMKAVASMASAQGLACEVSLETPMACGIGICFTCVAKVGTAEDWDYKRTCVEGPVFDAAQIVWN
jgi:dihydroorotate dehydrogenase electron transfer subunit